MKRNNCWEIMECDRRPGGENVKEFGICPATIDSEYNGLNDGDYGGRCCWAIAGTFCGGKPQGIHAEKIIDCIKCEVFKQVSEEEGREFVFHP